MKAKKILKIIVVLLLVLVGVLIAVPFVFEGKIKTLVKESVNKNLNAKFDFSDVDLSFFKSFPQATVTIEDMSLVNFKPFEGDTLLVAKTVSVSMSVKELFKDKSEPMVINSFVIDEAKVNVLVNKDGKANYDIAKADASEKSETPNDAQEGFSLSLESYSINSTTIGYTDEGSEMQLLIDGLNHAGSGDLSAEEAKFDTDTEALVSFEMDSVRYLNKNSLKLDALIGVDLKNNKYTFLENKALINQLPLVFDGYVKLNDDNQEVDVTFKTPSSDFKNFLAVIPEVYSKNIGQVETKGNFEVDGFFKGIVDATHIPAFNIQVVSNDASFKYPDLPKSVQDINLKTTVANKSGLVKDTYVAIEQLSFRIDEDRFSAQSFISNLTENPMVKASIKGRLNLANLSKAYPVDLEMALKGILEADIKTEFDMNSIEREQYVNTKNEGRLKLSDFEYTSDEMKHPVAIAIADVTFNPKTVALNAFEAKTGSTDIQAKGTIANLLGFMFNNENMKGDFTLNSNNFVLNDFMVSEATAEQEETNEENRSDEQAGEQIKIPSFLDATVKANANTVVYDNLKLKNVTGVLRIKDQKAILENVSSDLFGGKLTLSGDVSTKTETPQFNMSLGMSAFDIAESFNGLDLFKALTPIAGALQGKMNSNITIGGNLNNDFTPDLASVSGDALAEILGSTISPKNSQALSLLGDKINFIDLDKIDLNRLKTTLSFKDGMVQVKPFQVKYQDVAINVSGSHSFDKTMSYKATFDVPAKYLGNDVKNALAKLNDGDAEEITVPVTANIAGTFTQPTVSTDLKQATANLTQQLVKQQQDKLVNQGKDEIENALGSLLGNKKEKDSVASKKDTVAGKKEDDIKKAAENAFKSLFGKKKKDTTN
ncbi:AsmA-like C-terminal region [Zhouia amylolytica]|uniref:AsmA-like C-terminal region n=1 Tax=Zhouia amylolytica TaxID=376730 RepID=A0A1I6VP09_9FLAO|nr:AsmA-like C-terminal region-containing protein [Zhouia amylolytica]SFT15331.1 AsmA-like C-terminal region [Zhouia amylolytica]